MMNRLAKPITAILVWAVVTGFSPLAGADRYELDKRVGDARDVLKEFMKSPDRAVMERMLSNCAAVAIFPRVIQGAFFVGGKYGTGVMCARDVEENTWSTPSFFGIGGGSFGLQFGGEAIDLILVIMNRRGVESLLEGKVTLGGSLSAAAGPVGRDLAADTDIKLTAEIYTYSRTKGLFAGIALKGAVVWHDSEADQIYYGRFLTAKDILLDKTVQPVRQAKELIRALKDFSGKN